MRPTPGEVIAGIRTILKQEIAPHLPADAQPQLKRVMAVLRDARWNEAAFDLLRENEVFAGLARSAGSRLAGDAAMAGLGADLAGAASFVSARSFAEANRINLGLRTCLAALIERVRDDRRADLDDLCGEIGAALLALRDDR